MANKNTKYLKSEKRKPTTATDRAMEKLKSANPEMFGSVKRRNK